MNEELIAAIRKTLEAKSTDELRRSYQTRDERIWSPEAFEAMRQLLTERKDHGVPQPAVLHQARYCGDDLTIRKWKQRKIRANNAAMILFFVVGMALVALDKKRDLYNRLA